MRIDFTEIEDVESFVNVPPGQYVCQIAEVKSSHARDGTPRWVMRLDVADGEFAGRIAGWDFLHWNDRGLPRVRDVLRFLGVDTVGIVDIQPKDLCGKRVRASFLEEVKEEDGREVHRLRVPYRGYESA